MQNSSGMSETHGGKGMIAEGTLPNCGPFWTDWQTLIRGSQRSCSNEKDKVGSFSFPMAAVPGHGRPLARFYATLRTNLASSASHLSGNHKGVNVSMPTTTAWPWNKYDVVSGSARPPLEKEPNIQRDPPGYIIYSRTPLIVYLGSTGVWSRTLSCRRPLRMDLAVPLVFYGSGSVSTTETSGLL